MASSAAQTLGKAGRTRLPADGKSHADIKLALPKSSDPVKLRLVPSKAPLVLDIIALLLLPAVLAVKILLHQPVLFSQIWIFLIPMAILLVLAWVRHARGVSGSFDPTQTVRELSFKTSSDEAIVTIFAARYPGVAYLTGPDINQRVEFTPASGAQGLFFDWVPTLAYALLFALVLRTYVIASFYIPSGSMENTLMKGDLLIANKFSYKLLGHDPKRGEIMIFIYPPGLEKDPSRPVDYIKRVIGLPGDKVEVRGGTVYVNQQPLDEPYIKERPNQDFGPVDVPQDAFFMMGDNRNKSADSRVWGFVPRKDLEGRALFVFWPPDHARSIH